MHKQKGTGFIVVLICIFIYIIINHFAKNSNNSTQPSQQAKSNNEVMNLEIKQSTFAKSGITITDIPNAPIFTIKNLNSFNWHDCDLTLNQDYKSHMDLIAVPSELQTNATDTNDTMVIGQAAFINSQGFHFDPTLQTPVNISVECQQPHFDSYNANWNN